MKRLWILAVMGLLGPAGCGGVAYYEKESMGRRVMQFDDSALEAAFKSKISSSRSVSGGRPGTSAGGGCGCN